MTTGEKREATSWLYWHLPVMTSLVAQTVKRLPTMQVDPGSIPGLGKSSGEGNGSPLQYSCLENPTDEWSLVDYSLWDHKESDTTEWLPFHFYLNESFQRNLTFPACIWSSTETLEASGGFGMGELKHDFSYLELSIVELRGSGECVQCTTSDIWYPGLSDLQFHFL